MDDYHFRGWATRTGIKCADGRIIMKDAFKHMDGKKVPLMWSHQHGDIDKVLGHAILEARNEGVYAYCKFNDTESGQKAKICVEHGDVEALSIYANKLQEKGGSVMHGVIREVSLVLAGANPGAYIEYVMEHGEESEENAIIYNDEEIDLTHEDVDDNEVVTSEQEVETSDAETETSDDNSDDIAHADKDDSKESKEESKEKTIQEIYDGMTAEQKEVVDIIGGLMVQEAIKNLEEELKSDKSEEKSGEKSEKSDNKASDKNENIKHDEGGNSTMKENVFDKSTTAEKNTLSHGDFETIVEMAKGSNVGSLKMAMDIYARENELAHGFDTEALTALLPEYKNITPGAPEILRPDQSWVMGVINKIHKSPYSRIRTRQADARIAELRAKGYQTKGDEKKVTDTIKLIGRTFDPQTVYVKDEIHRDDIIDTVDFDQVAYMWGLMRDNMYETLALAALVGDGRDDADPDKIHENHIRSIYNDDELYTIHTDVDIAKAKAELQGSNTSVNFGENYIYAEAIITAALYSREKFKGSGKPDLYCTPHLVNVMLLARDLNGRRIYDSKADLAKALNVGEIHEIEQLEGRTRTDKSGAEKKLLGLFVNLADYQFGSTKDGEVTKFEDFDIDFNKHKYLMETRLSGALTKLYSAIALEEPVADGE